MNPLLLFTGFVVVSGISWPVMKIGVSHMPPFWFSELRLVVGVLSLFLIARLTGEKKMLPETGNWPVILGVGVLQMTLFVALSHYGLTAAGAGRSAVLVYTTPLWVAPLALLVLREPLGWRQVVGAVLGLAGIVLLFDPTHFDWNDGRVVLANAALLGASFSWAIAILLIRAHRWRGTPLQTAPWQMLIGVVLVLPLAWTIEGPPLVGWGWPAVPALVYTGTLATAFAFWSLIVLGRALPATTVAVGSLGTPALGVVAAAIALGEPLRFDVLAGLGLVGLGVLVTVLQRRPANP